VINMADTVSLKNQRFLDFPYKKLKW